MGLPATHVTGGALVLMDASSMATSVYDKNCITEIQAIFSKEIVLLG